MSDEVMMALGDFRFALATAAYAELERSRTYRWAKHDRVGRAPAYQFVGEGEDDVSLSGTIYPHFRGGLGQVEAMAAMAAQGEPLTLTDGRGEVWGQFVIKAVSEGQAALDGVGVAWRQNFDLELARYGGDG